MPFLFDLAAPGVGCIGGDGGHSRGQVALPCAWGRLLRKTPGIIGRIPSRMSWSLHHSRTTRWATGFQSGEGRRRGRLAVTVGQRRAAVIIVWASSSVVSLLLEVVAVDAISSAVSPSSSSSPHANRRTGFSRQVRLPVRDPQETAQPLALQPLIIPVQPLDPPNHGRGGPLISWLLMLLLTVHTHQKLAQPSHLLVTEVRVPHPRQEPHHPCGVTLST